MDQLGQSSVTNLGAHAETLGGTLCRGQFLSRRQTPALDEVGDAANDLGDEGLRWILAESDLAK